MLMTTDVDLSTIDLVVSEDSTINRVGNNKVNGVKVDTKTAKSKSYDKSKGKNMAKLKALA